MKIETFEEFKDTYFNGDEKAALRQLAYEGYNMDLKYTKTGDTIQKILDSLNDKQVDLYMKYFYKENEKNPERFNKFLNLSNNLTQLNLDYEEIEKSKVNPFKAKIAKTLLKLLISGASIVGLAALSNGNDTIIGVAKPIASFLSAYFSGELGLNILNYFRYKSAKKQIDQNTADQNRYIEDGGKVL